MLLVAGGVEFQNQGKQMKYNPQELVGERNWLLIDSTYLQSILPMQSGS